MSILENLLAQSGNLDLGAIGQQIGLSPDQVRQGAEAMAGHVAGGGNPDGAAETAAASTGLDLGKLTALAPMLLPLLTQFLGSAGQGGAGQGGEAGGGLLGSLGGLLDRDGDGNPINDIAGMAGGLLGGNKQ